jgi:hypothetical protein
LLHNLLFHQLELVLFSNIQFLPVFKFRMTLIPKTGDQLGISVIIVDVLFLALAALAICFRLWARRMTKKPLCFNDYAVIVALVSLLPNNCAIRLSRIVA